MHANQLILKCHLFSLKPENFAFCALLECTQEIISINKTIDGKFPLIKFSHKTLFLGGSQGHISKLP